MEIRALGIVQNEEDVVRECVEWASRFCERIWVWDLGSTDRTWEILQNLRSERVCADRRPDVSYSRTVRALLLGEIRSQIPDGAWVYKLDADEFVVGDPRRTLEAAEREGADLVHAWHLDFYPTHDDIRRLNEMGEATWEAIPLLGRLRSYRVSWREWRFLRLAPHVAWKIADGRNRLRRSAGGRLERSRHSILIRHYR